jgi:uncharacterized membrane protein
MNVTATAGADTAGAGTAASRAARVDGWIARVLRTGTLLSIGLLVIGVALMTLAGRSPLDKTWLPLDLGRIPADVLALRPEGFLWLGLLATLSTPLLRVAASIVGFLGAGERRMAGLGIAVLIVIALAVVVAQGTAA